MLALKAQVPNQELSSFSAISTTPSSRVNLFPLLPCDERFTGGKFGTQEAIDKYCKEAAVPSTFHYGVGSFGNVKTY